MNYDTRIDRTRATSHHQTIQGRKTHRRVNTPAAANRRQRTSVSQMTANQPQMGQIAVENLSGPARAILMANAVKTVAANPVFQPFVGAGINKGGGWQLRVKSCIKYCYLRHIFEDFFKGFDAFEVDGIVYGGENR